jgi:endonuclease/exonuclease/phosphatase family metal-dependent hydrolase
MATRRFLGKMKGNFRPAARRVPASRREDVESDPFVVISANLWHDWPRHRRLPERLESFARLVEQEQAQVVLLQEVARTRDLVSDVWLADRLGMAYVYARVNGQQDALGFEEGLAILSRHPLKSSQSVELHPSLRPFARRMALAAQLETSVFDFWVVSTHLSLLNWINASHVSHLRSWVDGMCPVPTFIGGDFNAGERSPQIQEVRRTWMDPFRMLNPLTDGTTHALNFPLRFGSRRRRLDYIFFQPGDGAWNVQDARHLHSPAERHSDHSAVLVQMAPVADGVCAHSAGRR